MRCWCAKGDCHRPRHYHVGYPPAVPEMVERLQSGLPVYWPTDPVAIDQAPYEAFAEVRHG